MMFAGGLGRIRIQPLDKRSNAFFFMLQLNVVLRAVGLRHFRMESIEARLQSLQDDVAFFTTEPNSHLPYLLKPPPPPSPARGSCPSRGTSWQRWSDAPVRSPGRRCGDTACRD